MPFLPELLHKAQSIQLLILDVDGVLTSGHIYYGAEESMEWRSFHIQDGLGIKLLHQIGVDVAIISGKKSAGVLRRINELNIKHYYLGHEDKRAAYKDIKTKLQLSDEQIAYAGDDLPDLPLLCQVGLSITVPAAPKIVKQQVHWITEQQGGCGAVREICELLLTAQGQYDNVMSTYLTS